MKKTVVAALLVGAFGTSFAMSNEEFAAQVQTHVKRIKADPKFEKSVADLCNAIGSQRRQEEPKCVAREKVASDKVFGNMSSSRLR